MGLRKFGHETSANAATSSRATRRSYGHVGGSDGLGNRAGITIRNERTNHVDQRLDSERLLHEGSQAPSSLFEVCISGGAEEHDAVEPPIAHQLLGEVGTSPVGELDIHRRDLELFVELERALHAVGSNDVVSNPPEPNLDDFGEGRIVFQNENAHGSRISVRPTLPLGESAFWRAENG